LELLLTFVIKTQVLMKGEAPENPKDYYDALIKNFFASYKAYAADVLKEPHQEPLAERLKITATVAESSSQTSTPYCFFIEGF